MFKFLLVSLSNLAVSYIKDDADKLISKGCKGVFEGKYSGFCACLGG